MQYNSSFWNTKREKERKNQKIESRTSTKINWWEAYLKRPAEHRFTKYRDYVKMLRGAMSQE